MTTAAKPKAGRGGKRVGAGRPVEADTRRKVVCVRLNAKEHAQFVKRGGNDWLREVLK